MSYRRNRNRSDLDDFVAYWFGRARSPSAPKEKDGPAVRPYQLNSHERKENERFNPDQS